MPRVVAVHRGGKKLRKRVSGRILSLLEGRADRVTWRAQLGGAPDTTGIRKACTPSPSGAHLIREHKIFEADVSAINATGPKGLLLNGDVLAYLGKINETYLKELEGRIHELGKLDLTNIKVE